MQVPVVAAFILIGSALGAPSFKITDGTDAERNEFPYQVSLQVEVLSVAWIHICGGSIISKRWILTAGHCITNYPDAIRRVVAGILKMDDTVETMQVICVQYDIVHEDFQGDVGPNDIALLKLASSLSFLDVSVQPIGLPIANVVPTGYANLTGWGFTSTGPVPDMPNILQKALVPIITLNQCAAALISIIGTSGTLTTTNVCTGPGPTGTISACNGDSGGPLAQDGQLVGIVSWGLSPCGALNAPFVYTQVSSFIDWINTNTT